MFMLFRNTKGFSAYSSPVILISRKVMQDKSSHRFQAPECENSQNKSSISLLKDTFSVLGSSRCEVLSVLDLKDAFHLL